eukprot:9357407-Pyramimonas_sp.AAC.1
MLCEWRKMCLPEGRTARGDPFEDYKELWLAVAPTIARRAAACDSRAKKKQASACLLIAGSPPDALWTPCVHLHLVCTAP